ncbi:AI-2E family transporter, partial [Streptomyces sp. McG5]|nr:AI-2E family transporter [Streptomyces sp. McG5]
MSRLPGWLERAGAELTRIGEALDERRARAEASEDAAAHSAHRVPERPSH